MKTSKNLNSLGRKVFVLYSHSRLIYHVVLTCPDYEKRYFERLKSSDTAEKARRKRIHLFLHKSRVKDNSGAI